MMSKKESLRTVYFRNFLVLIAIPILLVFAVSLNVIKVIVRNSMLSAIRSAQETVVATLSEDIKSTSMQLSHLIHINDNQLMELAAQTNTLDLQKRANYGNLVNDAFNSAIPPEEDMVSCMIYMNSGRSTYWKDEILISPEQLKQEPWYQEAMQKKNKIVTGSYDTSVQKLTYSYIRSNELVLTFAFSPDLSVDKSGTIEMVILFMKTDVGERMKANQLPGSRILLDGENQPLLGKWKIQEPEIEQRGLLTEGTHHVRMKDGSSGMKRMTFVVTEVPETGWKVVDYMETKQLTQAFNQIAFIVSAVVLALMGLFYCFSRYFLKNIITPVHTMVYGLKAVEEGNLEIHIDAAGQGEIRTAIHSFNHMVRQLKTTMEEKEEAQQKKLDAEVQALQSQINPHFLVNTLNSIRFMAQVSKYEGIRKMAEALINILTCSFRKNNSFYTVEEEMAVLDSYIYLMKIRYSNGFDAEYQVEEDCKEIMIPRLILQPIAENSIIHGMADMEEIGCLKIHVWREKDLLYIEIRDNGKGMTPEQIHRAMKPGVEQSSDNYSIGIRNVLGRLALYFGEKAGLRLESDHQTYTKAVLWLPAIEKDREKKEEE